MTDGLLTGVQGFGPLHHVICNAGMAAPGYLLESNIETHRKQMDVNYFGCLNVVMVGSLGGVTRRSGEGEGLFWLGQTQGRTYV